MQLISLPAFTDNYIWMLHNNGHALVVDPGDSRPVIEALNRLNVKLEAILITHHHSDHTGGVDELRRLTRCQVFGPAKETMPEPITRLIEGETVELLGLSFHVVEVPGHTAGHIAYYGQQFNGTPLLFCGDTLFSGGCGRLFEGTSAEMLNSLDRLSTLPNDTLVCCAHEYTLSNLKFALTVDPTNKYLADYSATCKTKRAKLQPTLPSTIGTERSINPFLRSREPALIEAVQTFDANANAKDEVSVFAALRQWKNSF